MVATARAWKQRTDNEVELEGARCSFQDKGKVVEHFKGGLIYKLQDPRSGQTSHAAGMPGLLLIFPQTLIKERKGV